MNRRSILTSLSSMCLASLAWSRQARAGSPRPNNAYSGKFDIGYAMRVKNGLFVDGRVVNGQYPVNVGGYGQWPLKTLAGGQVGEWRASSSESPVSSPVAAQSTSTPPKKSDTVIQQQPIVIYVLVNLTSPDASPKITLAPPGVTF